MTLNKRALLVILPSIVLSFILAFLTVYHSHKASLLALEKTQLNLLATELQSSYSRYVSFGESYLNATVQGESFRQFLRETNDNYRQIALGGSLERNLRSYQQYQSNFFSLAILSNAGEVEYYYESSDDPFSAISPSQIALATDLFASVETMRWTHEATPTATRIIDTLLVDRSTYIAPIPSRRNNAMVVQLAIEATGFDQRRSSASANYDITLINNNPEALPPESELEVRVALPTGKLMIVQPKAAYLAQKLTPVQQWFIATTIIFSLCSAALLLILVRRYLTKPVADLEHALTEVHHDQADTITLPPSGSTEIARLGQLFQALYGQMADAFRKTRTLAESDQLTGLHNLTFMTKSCASTLIRAQEHNYRVAFLYVDLDNFKFVNDRFGHDVGDSLLKNFAKKMRLLSTVLEPAFGRPHHHVFISRIAGDEFGIVIENADDNEADLFAAEILQIFQRGFALEDTRFPVTASIGIAMFPDDGKSLSQLVSNADTAMYQAKELGKNRYSFYSQALAVKMRRKRDIEMELKILSEDDELYLVYMPLVSTKTGRISGVEALLRWQSPKLGHVSPAEFIPIAENCGLFNKIDHWVIKASMRDYADLAARLGADVKLSLNLSSAQLRHAETAELIIETAMRYALNPRNIQLEMTETFGVDYSRDVDNLLHKLRSEHFRIAIDDFGTGFTSLTQMVEYPVDMIKLDRAFIEKARHSERTSILRPLIEMCHAQGMEVTAEGIETAEQLEALSAAGCDYLQGFYYGKPCRLEALGVDLSEGRRTGDGTLRTSQP